MQDGKVIASKIAKFWDTISSGWNEIWGPHIHHGYYENNELIAPVEAQVRLIEKISALMKIRKGQKILDAGCGLGGSSIFLAENFGADVSGITLSRIQAEMAARKAVDANVKNVSFRVENALQMKSFKNEIFDLVWSLESCEQFFDKAQFIRQAERTLKKNGKLMLATWCSSKDVYSGRDAKAYKRLCLAFDLPYMPSRDYYSKTLKASGLQIEKALDWTKNVEQSWDIGISLVKAYSFFKILRTTGLRGLIFTRQLRLMQQAYRDNMLVYMVFVCSKK